MSAPLAPTRIAAFAVPLRNAAAGAGAAASTSRPRRRLSDRLNSSTDDGLTLEHFLLRTRFLALYRSIVRATRDIPNPQARRDTLAWYRSDLFPPALKLERDLINLKEHLAQGYRQLKQIQGQFSLLGAGGIRTQSSSRSGNSTGAAMADSLTDPAGYVGFLHTLLERGIADRLVLDLRPDTDFAARHLQNATHLPGGWAELNSRFSTYLPPRGSPFLVLCLEADESDVRRNLGDRDGLIGIIVCRQTHGVTGRNSSTSAEDALLDPLGASEASLWAAAQQAGVLRSSTASRGQSGAASGSSSPFSSPNGSRRSAHTIASSSQTESRHGPRAADDIPHLMGQPSPALARTYDAYIRSALRGKASARALDLGCGAGRDLAWLAYRGHMDRAHPSVSQTDGESESGLSWRVTGLDNVRPVLQRAQHLMDAYGLMLSAPATELAEHSSQAAGCEGLLWGQVSPTGSLLALRTSGPQDTGGRNGKPFLVNGSLAAEQLDGVLLPQDASAYALALPHGQLQKDMEAEPFDLVILVRFLPRTLLWDRPDTIHALVRRSHETSSAQSSPVASELPHFHGGFVLISHFVVPEEDQAQELPASECENRPALRRVFDAPPPSGRLQAGEIRRLVASWNAWWEGQQEAAGQGVAAEWTIVEDVVEPIEDGRAVQSVLIQRR
ncbi:hypothetical protein OC842_005393 [Tilletia horrida]|uniref:Rhodanese domain-containing protein n=1 Tax=Tilletia horrida TaxID=155126 RepID=A0AAN6JJ14_9BASI|nr:hypothetical protein OC842_005393 [Tilletia horrida]